MHIPKNYFHDRVVLFLLTVNSFFVVLITLFITFRLGDSHEHLFSQVRTNLGINGGYIPGNKFSFVQFILFSVFVLVFHFILSVRTYPIRHHLSRAILALGTLLILFATVVSNALFGLN